MFLDFYQMQEQPFGVTPDPRFLYLGQSHREALASLYYGIEADRGFMVLIAPPGLGKTTLIFQLIEKLQPDCPNRVLVSDAMQLARIDSVPVERSGSRRQRHGDWLPCITN